MVSGVAAWEEQSWAGGKVRVGDVTFETVVPKVRCLATHANPLTGERDLEVMQSLVKMFAQKEPTFGIGMLSEAGGEIRVGDPRRSGLDCPLWPGAGALMLSGDPFGFTIWRLSPHESPIIVENGRLAAARQGGESGNKKLFQDRLAKFMEK